MKLLTMGEALIVLDPQEIGSLTSVDTFKRRIGGAEVNVAVGLARLGCEVRWFGRLGRDPFGQYIYRFLRGEGVDVGQVQFAPDAPTGLYVKERLQADKIYGYYYRAFSAASKLKAEMLPCDLLEGIDYLHLTGITPALSQSCEKAVLALAEAAKERGITVSFDPNLRLKLWDLPKAREVLSRLAGLADIVLPGLDEGKLLWGEEIGWREEWSPQEAGEHLGRYLLALGAGTAVVKLGAAGAVLVEKERIFFQPAFKVRPVDTVGAGDGFAAGFLGGLLKNKSLDEAVELGQAVAAHVVSCPGDLDGLPTAEELAVFLGERREVER